MKILDQLETFYGIFANLRLKSLVDFRDIFKFIFE